MKNFELKKLAGGLAAVGLLACYSFSASAAEACPESLDPAADYKCVFFDVGTSFNGADANSQTTAFYELGYTGTLATSIYSPFSLPTVGSNIIDSNIKTVINYYGLNTGGALQNFTTLAGNTVALKDTAGFPDQKNIDSLNSDGSGVPPVDTENFDDANTFGGIGWGLTYDYFFTGTLNASGPIFNDGYIDFIFQNWVTGASEQVLRVDINGSLIEPANLTLFGEVSFDWTGGPADIYGLNSVGDGTNDCTSTLCQNFFNFLTTSPTEFFELDGDGVVISMKLDSNVNPPIPQANQLVALAGTDGETYWVRQTTLDGSVRFAVPEPGSLALLGLGLAGLGLSARRRAKKA